MGVEGRHRPTWRSQGQARHLYQVVGNETACICKDNVTLTKFRFCNIDKQER